MAGKTAKRAAKAAAARVKGKATSGSTALRGGSVPASGQSQETFALDGRGQRLRENLQKVATVAREDMKELAVLQCYPESGEQTKEEKANQKKTLKKANQVLQTVQQHLKKVEASPNKGGLDKQREQLETCTNLASYLITCHTEFNKQAPDAEALYAALDSPEPLGVIMDAAAWMKVLRARAHWHLLFREFQKYAACFCVDSEPAPCF